ncbi:hypothetical protein HDU93_006508 [Gonapodya sp. JEL0774]|nr:hypothetical protein HDU93_006508 [Gonapodya sp. JEL0774]
MAHRGGNNVGLLSMFDPLSSLSSPLPGAQMQDQQRESDCLSYQTRQALEVQQPHLRSQSATSSPTRHTNATASHQLAQTTKPAQPSQPLHLGSLDSFETLPWPSPSSLGPTTDSTSPASRDNFRPASLRRSLSVSQVSTSVSSPAAGTSGRPAASSPPPSPTAGIKRFVVHEVKRSDTLAGVALLYGVKITDIRGANPHLWSSDAIHHFPSLHVPLEAITNPTVRGAIPRNLIFSMAATEKAPLRRLSRDLSVERLKGRLSGEKDRTTYGVDKDGNVIALRPGHGRSISSSGPPSPSTQYITAPLHRTNSTHSTSSVTSATSSHRERSDPTPTSFRTSVSSPLGLHEDPFGSSPGTGEDQPDEDEDEIVVVVRAGEGRVSQRQGSQGNGGMATSTGTPTTFSAPTSTLGPPIPFAPKASASSKPPVLALSSSSSSSFLPSSASSSVRPFSSSSSTSPRLGTASPSGSSHRATTSSLLRAVDDDLEATMRSLRDVFGDGVMKGLKGKSSDGTSTLASSKVEDPRGRDMFRRGDSNREQEARAGRGGTKFVSVGDLNNLTVPPRTGTASPRPGSGSSGSSGKAKPASPAPFVDPATLPRFSSGFADDPTLHGPTHMPLSLAEVDRPASPSGSASSYRRYRHVSASVTRSEDRASGRPRRNMSSTALVSLAKGSGGMSKLARQLMGKNGGETGEDDTRKFFGLEDDEEEGTWENAVSLNTSGSNTTSTKSAGKTESERADFGRRWGTMERIESGTEM